MKKVKGALAGKEFAQRIRKVQAEHPGSEELITRKLKDAPRPDRGTRFVLARARALTERESYVTDAQSSIGFQPVFTATRHAPRQAGCLCYFGIRPD